jgi:hypothetical protein
MFQEIYDAAKALDEKKLRAILAENYTLQVTRHDSPFSNTPCCLLAFEGEHMAVELLVSLGVSPVGAVQGYARAGNRQAVLRFIAGKRDCAEHYAAIRAAAEGGHMELLLYLLDLEGGSALYESRVYAAVRGGFQGADKTVLDWLIAHYSELPSFSHFAIRGAAESVRYQLVERIYATHQLYLKENAAVLAHNTIVSGNHPQDIVISIVAGYAHAGFEDFLLPFIIGNKAYIDIAARCAAQGNHSDLVFKLLRRFDATADAAAQGAGEAGATPLLCRIIEEKGGSPNAGVEGAAGGGHMGLVRMLIIKYGASREIALDLARRGKHIALEQMLCSHEFVGTFEKRKILARKASLRDQYALWCVASIDPAMKFLLIQYSRGKVGLFNQFNLPVELAYKIFFNLMQSSLSETPLNELEGSRVSLCIQQSYLIRDLQALYYQNHIVKLFASLTQAHRHQDRADSLVLAIAAAESCKELQELVVEQVRLASDRQGGVAGGGEQPFVHQRTFTCAPDQNELFHELISFWGRMFTPVGNSRVVESCDAVVVPK